MATLGWFVTMPCPVISSPSSCPAPILTIIALSRTLSPHSRRRPRPRVYADEVAVFQPRAPLVETAEHPFDDASLAAWEVAQKQQGLSTASSSSAAIARPAAAPKKPIDPLAGADDDDDAPFGSSVDPLSAAASDDDPLLGRASVVGTWLTRRSASCSHRSFALARSIVVTSPALGTSYFKGMTRKVRAVWLPIVWSRALLTNRLRGASGMGGRL